MAVGSSSRHLSETNSLYAMLSASRFLKDAVQPTHPRNPTRESAVARLSHKPRILSTNYCKTQINKDIYFYKTRKRIWTLVITYFLWNLAGVITMFLLRCFIGTPLGFDTFGSFLRQFWCSNVWNENTVNLLGQHTHYMHRLTGHCGIFVI